MNLTRTSTCGNYCSWHCVHKKHRNWVLKRDCRFFKKTMNDQTSSPGLMSSFRELTFYSMILRTWKTSVLISSVSDLISYDFLNKRCSDMKTAALFQRESTLNPRRSAVFFWTVKIECSALISADAALTYSDLALKLKHADWNIKSR